VVFNAAQGTKSQAGDVEGFGQASGGADVREYNFGGQGEKGDFEMTGKQLSWALGIVATLIAIVSGGFALWPSVGWTTPSTHNADITEVQINMVASSEAIIEAISGLRDEWKCDEYDEELLYLEHELADATHVENATEIQHDIDKIKAKMLKLDCSRFEDFG